MSGPAGRLATSTGMWSTSGTWWTLSCQLRRSFSSGLLEIYVLAAEEKVRITPGVRAAVSDSLSGSGLGEECGRIAGPAFLVQGRRRKNIYFLNGLGIFCASQFGTPAERKLSNVIITNCNLYFVCVITRAIICNVAMQCGTDCHGVRMSSLLLYEYIVFFATILIL